MSVAIGAAETKKLNNDDKIIYSFMEDGELQEGKYGRLQCMLLQKS